MIFDFPNISFKDEEWLYILECYLKGWTETPFTYLDGYNVDTLKFYDGFIGTLLKHTERIYKICPDFLDGRFVSSWKYQGKLFRVMHPVLNVDKDGNESVAFPKVEYHNMITHWTDDYAFAGLLQKLNPDSEYVILEAETGDHFAFNVNGFRKEYNCEEQFTQKEREFIFPMYKECIKEYHMSINDFVNMKRVELKEGCDEKVAH